MCIINSTSVCHKQLLQLPGFEERDIFKLLGIFTAIAEILILFYLCHCFVQNCYSVICVPLSGGAPHFWKQCEAGNKNFFFFFFDEVKFYSPPVFKNGKASLQSSVQAKGGSSRAEVERGYCCVYLPDGSASLAPTRSGQPIKEMLSSLCEKRGFPLKDVIIYLHGKDKVRAEQEVFKNICCTSSTFGLPLPTSSLCVILDLTFY